MILAFKLFFYMAWVDMYSKSGILESIYLSILTNSPPYSNWNIEVIKAERGLEYRSKNKLA